MAASLAGAAFEARAIMSLARLGFALRRVGGPHDGGVDVEGAWRLSPALAVRVVGQCKSGGRTTGVGLAREVAALVGAQTGGAAAGAGAGPPSLGLAVSASRFSTHFMRHMMAAAAPLVAVHIPPPGPDADGVLSFVVNKAAQRLLPGLTVRPPARGGAHDVAVLHDGALVPAFESGAV